MTRFTARFRIRVAIFLLFAVCGVSCIPFVPVYYAYPTASFTPRVTPTGPSDEIHAFRVEVVETFRSDGVIHEASQIYSAIPLSKQGTVPAQATVGIDYGWIWNCIALIFTRHTDKFVMVKLYRPGYQTVEIRLWNSKVIWKEAVDLAAREKAIDDLLMSTWEQGERDDDHLNDINERIGYFPSLAPGSRSDEHRKVLLFAVTEYEKLSLMATYSQFQARLKTKTNRLGELIED